MYENRRTDTALQLQACGTRPMGAADRDATGELIDLAGRIMLTHAIDPALAMRALEIDPMAAEQMIRVGVLSTPLDSRGEDRLRLFVSCLLRLEWRFGHDAKAIRHALETPVDTLDGATPAQLIGGDLDDLRRLRTAIETIQAPKTKWWRVGH